MGNEDQRDGMQRFYQRQGAAEGSSRRPSRRDGPARGNRKKGPLRWATRRRAKLGALGVLIAFVVTVVGFSVLFVYGMSEDIDPRGLEIENRTGEIVLIYLAPAGGGEERSLFVPEIPPRTTVESGITCGAAEFVARTEEGQLLDRRGPFDGCNLDKWIIEDPQER
jgi:hypothetical protein